MRQIVSSGSVKAIWLNRDSILDTLYKVARESSAVFPEIIEVRLFGSLATGEHTGLSDIDLFVLTESTEQNPIERMRPYFSFFADRLNISIDMIVATNNELNSYKDILIDSIVLVHR